MKKKIALLLSFSILFAGIDIYTKINKDTIYVGDKVQVSIIAKSTDSLKLDFPELSIDNVDITLSTISTTDSSLILSLQFWRSGSHEFPSLKISTEEKGLNQNTLRTEIISFNILDRVEGSDGKLKGSKSNKKIQLPFTQKQILLIFIIIILSLGSYLFIRRNKTFEKNINNFQKIDFLNEALFQIEKLEVPVINEIKELEGFYLSLSDIIKKYLLGKFFFKATKMTTSEILTYLSINNIPAIGLKNILEEADMCKFAQKKYGATRLLKAKEKTKFLLKSFENLNI